jgi:hypothetical protein
MDLTLVGAQGFAPLQIVPNSIGNLLLRNLLNSNDRSDYLHTENICLTPLLGRDFSLPIDRANPE